MLTPFSAFGKQRTIDRPQKGGRLLTDRTGELVFKILWSYVEVMVHHSFITRDRKQRVQFARHEAPRTHGLTVCNATPQYMISKRSRCKSHCNKVACHSEGRQHKRTATQLILGTGKQESQTLISSSLPTRRHMSWVAGAPRRVVPKSRRVDKPMT